MQYDVLNTTQTSVSHILCLWFYKNSGYVLSEIESNPILNQNHPLFLILSSSSISLILMYIHVVHNQRLGQYHVRSRAGDNSKQFKFKFKFHHNLSSYMIYDNIAGLAGILRRSALLTYPPLS